MFKGIEGMLRICKVIQDYLEAFKGSKGNFGKKIGLFSVEISFFVCRIIWFC